MPAGFRPVLRFDELVEGTLSEVLVDGRSVALARVGDQVYGLHGSCPHAGGPLAEGILEGTTLTCPQHGWSFDVTTGACLVNPEDAAATVPVRVVGGVVCIQA